MTTQIQVRGAANATQQARTLASRELDVDTTYSRLSVHDGAIAGGIEHVNWIDLQNGRMNYASASGTNAVTATYSPAPTALVAGMAFFFKAANTNTGAVTFSPNGLTAKNVYKKDTISGTLIALAAGDIIQNGVYRVSYDGTQWQLEGGSGGIASVSQGELNTSTGTVSVTTTASSSQFLTLPGGQYGFYPQFSRSGGWTGAKIAVSIFGVVGGTTGVDYTSMGTSYSSILNIFVNGNSFLTACMGIQRYITSSPPFDMGDGQAGGFLFLKLDPAGNVLASYNADVPPWAYNGPTDIRAVKKCPVTGTKYRKVLKKRSIEQIMEGVPAEFEYEPITQAIKNADMGIIPHPFGELGAGETVVLLDPMDDRIARLIEYQNAGGDISEALAKIKPDNERLRRKGPKGVMQVRFTT